MTYGEYTWEETMDVTSSGNLSHIMYDLRSLKSRCDVSHLLNKYGLTGEVAEIGVDMGHFSKSVLADWKGQVYYAIDLWEKQDPGIYPETHFDHDLSFRSASDVAQNDKRMIMLKIHSVIAACAFPDRLLDWVWIDANHEYQPVLDDMEAWYPKMKHGGVFSGHDYFLPTVRRAVNKFMNERKVPFVVSADSWWSVKV